MISLIAAMAQNRVIGLNGDLPWHLPADLKHFKATTLGKPVIMGRRTWDEVGRPLPGRRNIVISRQAGLQLPGAECVSSLAQALEMTADQAEVMVIGGAQIYAAALPQAQRFYRTLVCGEPAGDTYFPELDWSQWQLLHESTHPADNKHAWPMKFQQFARITSA